MKILPLKGLKSVRVYQLYQQVLIALAVLPTSGAKSITDFLSEFEDKSIDERRQILRAAAMFFDFQGDDLKTILDFVTDERTGIEMSQQVQIMSPDDIVDTVTDVLMNCSEIRTFFWTGIEQKKSPTIQ